MFCNRVYYGNIIFAALGFNRVPTSVLLLELGKKIKKTLFLVSDGSESHQKSRYLFILDISYNCLKPVWKAVAILFFCLAVSRCLGQSAPTCAISNPNSSFEVPLVKGSSSEMVDANKVQGWRTTDSKSQIEIWSAGALDPLTQKTVPAFVGNQFIELNAGSAAKLYQDFSTPSPTVFTVHFAHRGRTGVDACRVYAGRPDAPATKVIDAADGNSAWGVYDASYMVPEGQTVTRFTFEAMSSAAKDLQVGNFLDDITITANNGIMGGDQLTVSCLSSEVKIPVGGIGTWLKDPHNPSETVANLASNGVNNITTIMGFKAPGVYRYTWKTAYCASALSITVTGGGIAKPYVRVAAPIRFGGVMQLTTDEVPRANYQWKGPNGFVSDQRSPVVDNNANPKLSGVYTLVVFRDGCESPPASINVMINSYQPDTVANSLNSLSNTSVELSPGGIAGQPLSQNLADASPAKSISAQATDNSDLKEVLPATSAMGSVSPTQGKSTHRAKPANQLGLADSKPVLESRKPVDGYYKKQILADAVPGGQAPLREADIMYAKRIWREIDLREKINHVLCAPKARLIDVILDAVNAGELTAYDPAGNNKDDLNGDGFSVVLTPQQVMDRLVDSVLVPLLDKEGNSIGSQMKSGEFNPDSVIKFRIKEDWIFDKQRSVFEPKIIGIAPMVRIEAAGQFLDDQPAFWIYFPQARSVFAKKAIAQRKNDATHLSFDDLFMKRIFSSYIVKVSNVEDLYIKHYARGIERIRESERIKKELMDYEHDLWSY